MAKNFQSLHLGKLRTLIIYVLGSTEAVAVSLVAHGAPDNKPTRN